MESFASLDDGCLVYKVINGLAPPPLEEFITLCLGNGRMTGTTRRGDCVIKIRFSEFNKSALSVTVSNLWNSVPGNIKECSSFADFKMKS